MGKSQSKYDACRTALGQRPFIDDMRFDDMVHGALKFSDHPRARVIAIHAQQARALDGVIRVFTADDIPGERMTGIIYQDWPVMVSTGETTRYVGDVLAGVVARTRQIAREACRLIRVEYEVLEPVTDPMDALTDRIKVHEKGNLLATTEFERGKDMDTAFASSDHVVEAQYTTQMIDHAFLEPECAIAKPMESDGNPGAVQVFTQSQGIYEDRHAIAAHPRPLKRKRSSPPWYPAAVRSAARKT